MVAHARYLKQEDLELKSRLHRPLHCQERREAGDRLEDVDAVLTFQELWDWWKGGGIHRQRKPYRKFDPSPTQSLG